MKAYSRYLPILAIFIFFLAACGYHNPYVYTGPEKVIYIKDWQNRTSEMGLDSDIYKSLLKWFQKSGSIKTTKTQEGADLILAGEIVFIDLPSLSYSSDSTTSQVKVRLKVRYILKDIASGKVLIEQPGKLWTESYLVGTSTAATRDNQDEALETIIDELCQKIYQKTLVELPKVE